MSDIRRMPKPEFDQPKRTVNYPLYFVFTVSVGLLWVWLEDAEVNYSTTVVAIFGLMTIGRGMSRFVQNEWATHQETKAMKGIK